MGVAGQPLGAWADGMLRMVESFGIPMTAEHGGAAGYLGAAGLTDAELDALRARLVA